MKARLSAIALMISMAAMLWCTAIFYPRYMQGEGNATLAWDGAGYYWYLPSVFIYHDLAKQDWAKKINEDYRPFPGSTDPPGFKVENGNTVMKYSCGMAIMESPFFLIGHVLAKPLGYAADGFSRPYAAAIQYGALLVAFVGLWLFRRLLLYYFTDGVVAVCLVLLVIGSNYLNYSAIDASLTHSWLFTLYVVLMLCSRRFHLRPSYPTAIAIGLLCGLATLTRPTDIIACLIPLLWGMESLRPKAIRAQIQKLLAQWQKLVVAMIVAGCVMSIQAIYWKTVSGHWLVYSYQEQGFSWLHPHVLDYTFSYRSGWVNYTPLVLLAFIGIVPFIRRGEPNRVMILAFWAVAYYIVTAWDIWWYAGSGGRAMIQYYPAVFFPIAAVIEYLSTHKRWRMVGVPFILLSIYINIWFTYQAHGGTLYDAEDGMSQQYYWRVIGRWSAPEETAKLKDGKYLYDGAMPKNARLLYSNSLHSRDVNGQDSMLTLDAKQQFSPTFRMPLNRTNERWVRAAATFHCVNREWTAWRMMQFVLGAYKGNEQEREAVIRVHRFLNDGDVKTLYVDMRLSHSTAADSMRVHFWNAESDKKIMIEDLKVWAF